MIKCDICDICDKNEAVTFYRIGKIYTMRCKEHVINELKFWREVSKEEYLIHKVLDS